MSTVVTTAEFLLTSEHFNKVFCREFYESRGSGMASYIKQIPIFIVKC